MTTLACSSDLEPALAIWGNLPTFLIRGDATGATWGFRRDDDPACASTICAGVTFVATISRFWIYSSRTFLSKTTT
jgi:hypothetical protein